MIKKIGSKLWDNYYDNYKKLVIIPFLLLIFFGSIMIYRETTTTHTLNKDISLKGGIHFTIFTNKTLQNLEQELINNFNNNDITIRTLTNSNGKIVGYEVTIGTQINKTQIISFLEDNYNLTITNDNFSYGKQSNTLGATFFNNVMVVLAISFVLMGVGIFFYFRNLIPAFSIVFSTFSDVVCILGVFSLFGIKISAASFGALLMIMGYSTDSDILLATNVIRRKDKPLKERMLRALKTELTQDAAALVAFGSMFVFANIQIIRDVAFVLLIGIVFDFINTWLGNATLQRLYLERSKK